MSDDIFDKEELLEELDDDWEFLEESVEMLKEDSVGLLGKIRTGVEAHDAETIWQSAHTIKSMVGNFAAGPAFEAAYVVETRGRADDIDAISAQVDELETELQRLVSALEALLASTRD
jgi:HPt (histidine-containing phosphotransfer) domain-containing protein